MERRLLVRGQTSGRSDDNVEAIRKRFKTYHLSTMPIIKHFEKLGKVKIVNSDREPDAVFADVAELFGGPVRKDSSNV
jgi:UMP-CMP kinase